MKDNRPHVFLACGVFKGIIHAPTSRPSNQQTQFLDAGLHATPKKLKLRVQEQINAISEPSIIVLGYGLCGNGLNEIQAGKHTLVIPKMDDCIAMFMGGRKVFLEEFTKEPGTYYLTKGWLQADTHPLSEYNHSVEKFGEETANYIMDMQYQHYKRLRFVAHTQDDLDANRPKALEIAELCKRWDMQYEEYLGTTDFVDALEKTISTPTQADDAFIIIQPGETLKQEMFQ
ncbi:MAG: DUF1638 domain-containing protein [Chloroflexi bacterium]|nr:DUF1638 domain-containing protein [Chloroflexota bacterium]